MSLLEKLYLRLPGFIQDAVVDWKGRSLGANRYGPEFFRLLAEAEARAEWSVGRLEEYRAQRLSGHFEHAQHSPFWAEAFQRHGVNIKSSRPFDELAKLPVLTKAEVRLHSARIQNPSFSGHRLVPVSTSGTTGTGLVFRETEESERQRWAVWWRYRRRLGIEFGTLCGLFGGKAIVPISQVSPPYWRHSRATQQVIFSPYHLSDRTAAAYMEKICAEGITWLHGYPSTLTMLATYVAESKITPPGCLRIITTGAENLSEHQRSIISRGLRAPVFEHYGLAESSANFSQEPDGLMYVDEDFSAVEFLPRGESDQRAIVGTNWHNPAFPLFRYDCGDLGRLAEGSQLTSAGMRSRQVIAVDGRQEDVLVLSNGVRLGRLDHIFKNMVNVREAQIAQSTAGQAVFRIVKGAAYGEADERQLRGEIEMRLGAYCRFEIEYVPTLPRTKSGKLRLVVSTLVGQGIAPPSSPSAS